jgi:hypothetical protein
MENVPTVLSGENIPGVQSVSHFSDKLDLTYEYPLYQCFPKCGMHTTGGTREDFKGYTAENKSLKIVPEFYVLPMNSNIKTIKQIR